MDKKSSYVTSEEEGPRAGFDVPGELGSGLAQEARSKEVERLLTKQQSMMLDFFSKPHTVTLLGFSVIALWMFGLSNTSSDTVKNVNRGILAILGMFCLFALLHFRDGPFRRPHPAVWRVIQGVSVFYLLALVFLLFQSAETARHLFTYWYPEVGVPLEDLSWASNCELTVTNIGSVLDRFVVVHFLGWAVKALMIRDPIILWTQSILWEFLEITFKFVLKNFAECWWDQWILDVLLCNGLGIVLGMWILKKFDIKHYKFVAKARGVRRSLHVTGVRKALHVTRLAPDPKEFVSSYRWEIFNSVKRFLSAVMVIVVVSVIDMNAFALKWVLWIPHDNPLNALRLWLWFVIGLPAMREVYEFATNPQCKRLGAQAWICLIILLTEVMIIVKFQKGLWDNDHQDPRIIYAWTAFLTAGVVWFVMYFLVFVCWCVGGKNGVQKRHLVNQKKQEKEDKDE